MLQLLAHTQPSGYWSCITVSWQDLFGRHALIDVWKMAAWHADYVSPKRWSPRLLSAMFFLPFSVPPERFRQQSSCCSLSPSTDNTPLLFLPNATVVMSEFDDYGTAAFCHFIQGEIIQSRGPDQLRQALLAEKYPEGPFSEWDTYVSDMTHVKEWTAQNCILRHWQYQVVLMMAAVNKPTQAWS